MRLPVDIFILNHKHINYCEAIVHKDGTVEYIRPSHVETLIRITGEDREVIYNKMPVSAAPIYWLTDYTGCISVWSGFYVRPERITQEQEYSLKRLIDSGLVKNKRLTG